MIFVVKTPDANWAKNPRIVVKNVPKKNVRKEYINGSIKSIIENIGMQITQKDP